MPARSAALDVPAIASSFYSLRPAAFEALVRAVTDLVARAFAGAFLPFHAAAVLLRAAFIDVGRLRRIFFRGACIRGLRIGNRACIAVVIIGICVVIIVVGAVIIVFGVVVFVVAAVV